ncbi:MAG: hypothetical protein JOZ07_15735 [Solirubrobacterales bacterium]|nr:hypothetical protein [Solirubrobacterales bacterium]
MPPAKRAPSKPAKKSPSTPKSATGGAKATATTARAGAQRTQTSVKGASTRARRAAAGAGGSDTVAAVAEQLAKGALKPRELVMLTRDRIQETLDEAASRGRVTRKDANELVAELVRRGRSGSDDLVGEVEGLLGKGKGQLETATRRARGAAPVDRIVRGADRARRAAGVGPTFPITGYDDLRVGQVQARVKELSRPELRKVLNYERKHANRKTVVAAIEKQLS